MRLNAWLFLSVIALIPPLAFSPARAGMFDRDPYSGAGGRTTSNDPLKQCNGADPVAAVVGCTAILNGRDSTLGMRSGALLNRGRAYLARDQAARPLADFEQAIKLDPKNSRAIANRGDYYQSQGDFGHALEDYNQAIAANPKDFEAYSQRGNLRLL